MTSKCGKCNSLSFELVEQSPRGSNYKLMFVQCSICGTPVGVMEYFNAGAQIEKVNKQIQVQIQNLEHKLNNIEFMLRQIASKR